ncbi:MAG: DUF5104 domain-containing protein [Ruminococcaceae bacterium]|nr:DUF5104 domain-containing protein [Oscillospiraceae bacterium]
MKRLALLFIIVTILIGVFPGCGSWQRVNEEKIYRQKIDAFFDALDAGDAEEMLALFSQTVVNSDSDLNEQIDKLISLYPRSTTTVMFDGLLGGEYEDEDGMFKSMACATIPIINNNEYYWVYIELIYEDDSSPDSIGLHRVYFYTADEYCMYFQDEDAAAPMELGLVVYAQRKMDQEIRCIESFPYAFTAIERDFDLSEMEAFLQSSDDWSAFVAKFGQPNAKGVTENCYYEIQESADKVIYLEIAVQDEEIIYANLVDEFDYIRCVLEEKTVN